MQRVERKTENDGFWARYTPTLSQDTPDITIWSTVDGLENFSSYCVVSYFLFLNIDVFIIS